MRTRPSRLESLQQSNLGSEAETPTREVLIKSWTKVYGRPPPKRTSNRLLTLSYHYHRQVALQGGLSKRTLRQLKAWANGDGPAGAKTVSSDGLGSVAPGTRLIREWNGKNHVVDIDGEAILYRGQTYTSLSAVARAITGARWSGPRFFEVTGK